MEFNFTDIDKKNKTHIDFLYEILQKRSHNISHRKMPEYNSHCNFVENHKYRKWKLIFKKGKLFGSYYITFENCIGINLLSNNTKAYKNLIENIISFETPLPEIKSFRNKYFLINSSPDNISLINALKTLNYKHIQLTYLCK